ncbi:iron-containing alcohol dehydrogenase, partial [Enterococcus faecalis]|uniref:iron-containing alcohol dehydrogenase n=1 Tax=Enterococcus faecalis TaxID=1351 RepID=UPI00403F4734
MQVPEALAQLGLRAPLVLTDPFLAGNGLLDRLLKTLADAGIAARAFAEVVADPTIGSIAAATAFA